MTEKKQNSSCILCTRNNDCHTKTSETDTNRSTGRPAIGDAVRDLSCSKHHGILAFQGQISLTLSALQDMQMPLVYQLGPRQEVETPSIGDVERAY